MEGFKTMDKSEYVSRMQGECRRIMEQIADAVNSAPTGRVISGSEMQVRDLMEKLRQKSFELAVQMRVDSHESTFSPCQGRDGQTVKEQGALLPQHDVVQRPDQLVAKAVGRRGTSQRLSGGQAVG
ncbi:MAG TPA: hypothetical protein VF518_16665 [Polyangia bacterium]